MRTPPLLPAMETSEAAQSDAVLAATLFAVDPVGTGGVILRAGWGPARDRWLADLYAMLPAEGPIRRVPLNVGEDRLLGGLDLVATLQAKRPVVESGLLAEADGGVVVLSMAERLAPSTVAHLTATLDRRCVVVERNGVAARPPARIGLVALDEGISEDEGVAVSLRDRIAFHVGLLDTARSDKVAAERDRVNIARARLALKQVACDDRIVAALCETAMALGIDSVRAPLLAVQAARAHAALAGRAHVVDADAVVAARLVLVPRATRMPEQQAPPDGDDASADDADGSREEEQDHPLDEAPDVDRALVDMVLEAARAAMPAEILDRLRSSRDTAARMSMPGKAGAAATAQRGRPIGTRPGELRGRARISVIETLRAAAPWQPLRRAAAGPAASTARRRAGVEIRSQDFRVTRFKQRAATTTIFVVDASGSSAANRLAEAKGAVELLLADCYVRRDEVALIAFRDRGAQVVLPPTRSLVRAKRCLAGLPGGGGTPLAAAIDLAGTMANSIVRKGQSPVIVFLTDGRANITRDGKPGIAQAEQEAAAASRVLRALGVRTLFVDTSPRPGAQAGQLAATMDATYLPLPYANSRQLSDAIQASVTAI